MRINEYRTLWILVFFDLPVQTKKEQRAASRFRNDLLEDGFRMFQFSIYVRHCPSRENSEVHIRRIKSMLPVHGHVGVITITDKQFGMMEVFYGRKPAELPNVPQQLELF